MLFIPVPDQILINYLSNVPFQMDVMLILRIFGIQNTKDFVTVELRWEMPSWLARGSYEIRATKEVKI